MNGRFRSLGLGDALSPTCWAAARCLVAKPGALMVLLILPLAACGRGDAPPPLTGNLTDARGAHAGSFRAPADNPGDYGNAAAPLHAAAQGATVERVQPTGKHK